MAHICHLDEDDCLTLLSICKAFHCGIKEEHSWALIYQSVVSLKDYLRETEGKPSFYEPNDLYVKSNGTIHQKSWHTTETTTIGVNQISFFIGRAVYAALDYGNAEDEEMTVPKPLEEVFLEMTESHNIDEGIEEMDDMSFVPVLNSVLNKCESRVSEDMNVSEHYRNVCRALVAEAIEVSTFLNQISKGTQELKRIKNIDNKEIDSLQVEVWAQLWMKVMRQLRSGVSLKTIDKKEFQNRQQREYELTPFEMLLDDISSKRYSLRKVSLPKQVEKDARTLILDFVRSRPPLKPANERILSPPPEKEPTLHDKLMAGIKNSPRLKPTPKSAFERRCDSFHMPRGTRFSIYTKAVAIDGPTDGPNDNVFQRFSFRNLSLRNYVLTPNPGVKNDTPIDSTPTSTSSTSRASLWRRLFNWKIY